MINYSLSYRTVKVASLDSAGNKQYDSVGDVVKTSVQKAYATAQSSGSMDENTFNKNVASRGVYSRADIQGVLDEVAAALEQKLLLGTRVYLDDLGTFFPSVSSKGVEDSRTFNAANHINKAYAGWTRPTDMATLAGVSFNYVPSEASAALATDNPAAATLNIALSAAAAAAAANMSTIRATYTLIASIASGQQSMGSVSGGGTYNYADIATLKATPNSGYAFFKWSDGSRSATRNVYMTANKSFTANFGTPSSMKLGTLTTANNTTITKGSTINVLKITSASGTDIEEEGLGLVQIDASGNETAISGVTYEQTDDNEGTFTIVPDLTLASTTVKLGVVKGSELIGTVDVPAASN